MAKTSDTTRLSKGIAAGEGAVKTYVSYQSTHQKDYSYYSGGAPAALVQNNTIMSC